MAAKGDWLGQWWEDFTGQTGRAEKDYAEEQAAKRQSEYEQDTRQYRDRMAEISNAIMNERYDPTLLTKTAYEDIKEDPKWKAAQAQALEQMLGWSRGGLTETDKAALDLANRETAAQEQAAMQAAEAQQRARGFSPGGAGALLSAQMAAQAGSNRRNQSGVQALGMMQNRQVGVAGQAGQLGNQVRGQEYGMASDLARNRDAISQFNAQAQTEAARARMQNRLGAYGMQGQTANSLPQMSMNAMNLGRVNPQEYDAAGQKQRDAWDAAGRAVETGADIAGMFFGKPPTSMLKGVVQGGK